MTIKAIRIVLRWIYCYCYFCFISVTVNNIPPWHSTLGVRSRSVRVMFCPHGTVNVHVPAWLHENLPLQFVPVHFLLQILSSKSRTNFPTNWYNIIYVLDNLCIFLLYFAYAKQICLCNLNKIWLSIQIFFNIW